jgi:hypothetical protein
MSSERCCHCTPIIESSERERHCIVRGDRREAVVRAAPEGFLESSPLPGSVALLFCCLSISTKHQAQARSQKN